MKTHKQPFTIYLPATADTPAKAVDEIIVEVYIDIDGEETLTPDSVDLIEHTQAHHLGLMTGVDIKNLRQKLGLNQLQFAAKLKCGKKSLSRWENGKGYPSPIINKILRLLDEGFLSLASLTAVDGPRPSSKLSPKAMQKLRKHTATVKTRNNKDTPQCAADSNKYALAA